jgi:hypothetical protein
LSGEASVMHVASGLASADLAALELLW